MAITVRSTVLSVDTSTERVVDFPDELQSFVDGCGDGLLPGRVWVGKDRGDSRSDGSRVAVAASRDRVVAHTDAGDISDGVEFARCATSDPQAQAACSSHPADGTR